jgi:hypothetical protein
MAGGGEEAQKISIAPVESNEGNKKCPKENAAHDAVFETLKVDWCEYEVKNKNAKEAVTLVAFEVGALPACEFGKKVYCIGFRKAAGKQCTVEPVRTRLLAGGNCFLALEYENAPKPPATEEETKFRVKTKSAGGVVGFTPEVAQVVR